MVGSSRCGRATLLRSRIKHGMSILVRLGGSLTLPVLKPRLFGFRYASSPRVDTDRAFPWIQNPDS